MTEHQDPASVRPAWRMKPEDRQRLADHPDFSFAWAEMSETERAVALGIVFPALSEDERKTLDGVAEAASEATHLQAELTTMSKLDPRRPEVARAFVEGANRARVLKTLRGEARERERSERIARRRAEAEQREALFERVGAIRAVADLRESTVVARGFLQDAVDLMLRWRGGELPTTPADCLGELEEALGEEREADECASARESPNTSEKAHG
jgi:hypothetical protein